MLPRINDLNSGFREILDVTGSQNRTVQAASRRDLCISHADGSTETFTERDDLGIMKRRKLIERQDPIGEILLDGLAGPLPDFALAAAFGIRATP